MNRFHIGQLSKSVDRIEFNCGQPDLNAYIRSYATQDCNRNVARVFVATPEENHSRLAGFFTLSAGSVSCTELPEDLTKTLPKYPIPVAILGRLAVDRKFQGQGLVSILLAAACQRVSHASQTLAVARIIVDAKATAAEFYRHFGFIPLPGALNKLFMPLKVFS